MEYYKDHSSLTDTHWALDKAIELEAFDDSSPEVVQTFMTQLDYCYNSQPAMPKDVENRVRWMIGAGYLERVDTGLRVTEQGRTWGKVLRFLVDGTFIIFGSAMPTRAWRTFHEALVNFNQYLCEIRGKLSTYLSPEHTRPARIEQLLAATGTLSRLPRFAHPVLAAEVYEQAAVLACRGELLRLREHKDWLETRARDREVLDGTQQRIEHLESILKFSGLDNALTTHKPRLSDFVNVGTLEESDERPADEKFGILAAPRLFTGDYNAAAEGAFSRDRSFAVAFIDIDDFKTFNKNHLETVVDRDMLPYFMRALESYCYGRAIAYRQGGDEYLVLLHNATEQEARVFFEGLRVQFATVKYPHTVKTKPTVSIGVHVITPNCEVTVFEAKRLANQAKDAAKDEPNKNCVRLSSELPSKS